jgi:Short C-terminal domain
MGRDRRQRRRRAAAIGGAAVAAKKHHDAKEAQQREEAAAPQQATPGEPGQAAEPVAAGGLTPEVMEQLKQLGELHEQNVLSDEEFEREKAKLLGPA